MHVMPRVSVIIPVYNRQQYLGEAIDSILGQSFADFELLVIDDGSTDGSCEIARAYSDCRIRLIVNDMNLGQPKTRNRGIHLARGAYIAMLDSDDVAYPQRLAQQVAFLERNPDHALIGSWKSSMGALGQPLRTPRQRPVRADQVSAWSLFRCPIVHPSVMARASVLRANPYCERFLIGADFELFVRLLASGHKLANLPEVLVHYRKHPGGISQAAASERAQQLARRAIFRTQLAGLGIDFTEEDLVRHDWLCHRPYVGAQRWLPDAAYLEWAALWLLELVRANQQVCRYPARELNRVIRHCWHKLCRKGRVCLGWRVWRYYWRSLQLADTWRGLHEGLQTRAESIRRPGCRQSGGFLRRPAGMPNKR